MTLDGVYIRISSSTKAPHWLPHFVLDTLLLQEITCQTYVNGVVASLHWNKKGPFPHFPLLTRVHRIENFKQAKEEVGILSSYRFKEVSFQRHDPQGNSKNICSRLVLYGFMLMKIYFLGNWANNRCYWNPKLQIWTKRFKLIKKPREKSLNWRKTKLPWSRGILYGSRIVKNFYHLHRCQCITLIQMRKIHMFHPTNLPLLLYMMLHFQCIWNKSIVHSSLRKFCLRGIMLFKKKIIPPAIISKKSLVP